MAVQNIQMNVKTAAGYDQLNPLTSASNVSYTNTVSGLAATNTQAAIDEVVVKTIAASLTVAGWTGDSAPYTQTVNVQDVSETSGSIICGLSSDAGSVVNCIATESNIKCTGRTDGTLTFTALIRKPVAPIPAVIYIMSGGVGIINAFPSAIDDTCWETVEVTTSKSWTVPEGVTHIKVTAIGGGGSSGAGQRIGGAGSGFVAEGNFNVTPNEAFAIVIGAGATDSKSAGGNSRFGDLLSTLGGLPPIVCTDICLGGNGGAGGGGASFAYVSSNSNVTAIGGVAQCWGDGGCALSSTNKATGAPGGGTLTAQGGIGQSVNDGSFLMAAGGGGAGIDGGDGGDAATPHNLGYSGHGGGAGGYGSEQIAPITDSSDAKPGKGYGAGGAGGENYKGASGICIIKYRKAVAA